MALSYRMPSTRYITTTAASTSHNVFDSDARNASAAPRKRLSMDSGQPSCCCTSSTAATASPSEWPLPRLKDSVAAGNCD